MTIGPVSFPGAKQSLGIVVLVILTLYLVNHVSALKSRVNP